jgi:hypothetical protein
MWKYLIPMLLVISDLQAASTQPPEPYSCQMYREAQKKCSYNTIGKCYVQHEVDRLRQQCLREGGRI